MMLMAYVEFHNLKFNSVIFSAEMDVFVFDNGSIYTICERIDGVFHSHKMAMIVSGAMIIPNNTWESEWRCAIDPFQVVYTLED